MKFLAIFATVLIAVTASTNEDQWIAFKQTHGKTYKNLLEERTRFGIFQRNLIKIKEHNARCDKGEETYLLGVTRFADLTHEEFKDILKGQIKNKPRLNATPTVFPEDLEVPDSIDWTEKGAVLEVKGQNPCGSCWAFSATGALEGQNAILNNAKISLSEQQLLDCSAAYGNGNCKEGGDMSAAFEYVRDYGIQSEKSYPYIRKQTECQYDASKTILKIKGYKNVTTSEEGLRKAVGTIGPMSIAMNSGPLQLYYSGIFSGKGCSHDLDHGVLVVGYGKASQWSGETKFWRVKNSWGKIWGENGYFRIKRDANNLCGIADDPTYPVL
uniref:Digestive cysteine protease intestain n=1 Tax=Leptinotarsa decemlineata TaxID=7539 RepID=A2I7P4_LEPDE|nr:digestive cysteine protease intestain [Leptinotarsa decemlineata]